MCGRLQPYVWQAATLCDSRLQPYVMAGESITAGCGASEPWDVWLRNGSCRYTKAEWKSLEYNRSRCSLDTSWGRRFHDELQAV